ncbi:MAG: hypothetical protein R3300_13770 [Candidatus Promineifilaceae bacterium]|nr:hypothetical protein [Candidatus Promineifilaceae bacterium]
MDRSQREACSADLLKAQEKLQAVRKQFQPGQSECALPAQGAVDDRWHRLLEEPPRLAPRGQNHPLPIHLGWGSHPLTQAVRDGLARRQDPAPPSQRLSSIAVSTARPSQPQPAPVRGVDLNPAQVDGDPGSNATDVDTTIRLYPELALAILREKEVATGRIWLLLRHLDESGQGWISFAAARQQLTASESPLRVCGWRQLRKLLARGEGLFWQRAAQRIWLRSVPKVAARLGLSRLQGRPIALPLAIVLASIGTVRAHFYASFHSGRQGANNQRRQKPISRATLSRKCGISRRTQRKYERRAGVRRRPNYAVGPPASVAEFQQQAWHRGHAAFRFTDKRGLLGRPGRAYVAWQLPNSYVGPHQVQPSGTQKQINRALADLSMKGMTGNGKAHTENSNWSRRFCATGLAAAVRYQRNRHNTRYWPVANKGQRSSTHLWHVLPGQAR